MHGFFGDYLKSLRKKEGLGLREFAVGVGLDPSYYSRIERGHAAPSDDAFARIAKGFDIPPASAEWMKLEIRAELERGRVPADVLEDEDLRPLLPAFFARLRLERQQSSDEMFELFKRVAAEDVADVRSIRVMEK